MHEAYEEAAARHLEDAAHLVADDRSDNAAYLAGYVVECSLKAILSQARALSPKSFGHDLLALSGDGLRLATLISPFVGRYQLPKTSEFEDLISNWSAEVRYAKTGSIAKIKAESWIRVSEEVYEMTVVKIILDGRVGG